MLGLFHGSERELASGFPHKELVEGSIPSATTNKYSVMKINSIITEKSNVIHFQGDYSHGYGVQNFDGMPVDSTYEEEVEFAKDEYGITNGREIMPGTWVGWKFEEPEYDNDELLMSGNVCVISTNHMDENDPFFKKVFDVVQQDAERAVQS